MSLVDTIPPRLFDKNARTLAMSIRSSVRVLKSFTTIVLRRSPVLLVVLGAWEATRRNRSKVLDLEASIAQLSTKIAEERARIRDKDFQITALESKIAEHSSQGAQRENEISDLERGIEDARSKESSLVQQLAEGRDSITASHTRVEALESQLATEEAEIKRLKDALEGETARVLEGRDWKAGAFRREGELVRELDQVRRVLAEDKKSIERMQEAIVGLEECCEEKQREIGSLMRANEKLQTEVDEARAKDDDISASLERALKCERLVAERDLLIFDLTTKVERLEFDQEVGDIPGRSSTLLRRTLDGTATISQPVSKTMVQSDDYGLKVSYPNDAVDPGYQVQKREDDTIAELEGKVAEMDRERREKEARIESLLDVTRKQEKRLGELEGQVLVITSADGDVDGLRTKERERFENDIEALRRKSEDVNEKIVKLEAELCAKDAQVKSLRQAKQELDARVARRDKSLAELRAKYAAEQGAPTQSEPRELRASSRFKDGYLPNAQTRDQYEQKIAELTDKLSECHGLLKAGINGPPGLPPGPLWGPPPYEPATSSKNDGANRMGAKSTGSFKSPPKFRG